MKYRLDKWKNCLVVLGAAMIGFTSTQTKAIDNDSSERICLDLWADRAGSCPAPIITAAYYQRDSNCHDKNYVSLYVVGKNFQRTTTAPTHYELNAKVVINGKVSYVFNKIQSGFACLQSGSASFAGAHMVVANPDGKVSNSLVIQDRTH